MQQVLEALMQHLDQHAPGGLRGAYLTGSWAAGGLQPDSDIDLLLVTQRSLTAGERADLTDFLLRFSGRRATVTPGRPLEVTSLVLEDVVPWRYPPVCDFLYGEWLRDEFTGGATPQPHTNPDIAVLIAGSRQHAECLRGAHPRTIFEPVPAHDLRRCIHDSLEPLLADLAGDERNVLLTLARMLVTLQTGEIVSKDEAAAKLLPDLPAPDRHTLSLASDAYLGHVVDDWDERQQEAQRTARHLAALIRQQAVD
ncbi:aminoglycoside adenylyltransferase domain-containing protein [Flexivirga sp. B27]